MRIKNAFKASETRSNEKELGIYGSFRPMIWFFIMLWSILGFVALGKLKNSLKK